MKNLLFLLLLLPVWAGAQDCTTEQYQKLLREADKAVEMGQYDLAVNKLQSAKVCRPEKGLEVDQKILVVFKGVNRQRELAIQHAEEARKQERLARMNADEAQKQKMLADTLRILAEEKTREAEASEKRVLKAFQQMKKANAEVVDLLLEGASRNILKLDYETALSQIQAAGRLNANPEAVSKYYMEIAFWHNEAGNISLAGNLIDSAALLLRKNISSLKFKTNTETAQNLLRTVLQELDSSNYCLLTKRYFPEMVKVDGGTVRIGSSIEKNGIADVKIESFYLSKYETTWWQYYLFCKSTGHEYFIRDWGVEGNNPVVYVNCYDAILYFNWLNKQFRLDSTFSLINEQIGIIKDSPTYYEVVFYPDQKGFRFPTEHEWEYAGKGGENQDHYIYSGSADINEVGWNYFNSGSRTHPVGLKKCNTLGLYDMTGNVWEWCWDGTATPTPKNRGIQKFFIAGLRGGAWNEGTVHSDLLFRNSNKSDLRANHVGFRVAQSL